MSESTVTDSPPNDVISPPSSSMIELIERNVQDVSGVLSDDTSNHQDDNDSVIADIFDDGAFNNPTNQVQIEEPIHLEQDVKSKRRKFLKKLMFGLDRKTVTCCSTQFSCVSCLSMLALLLNTICLLAIIGLSIASNISYQSLQIVDIMSYVTESRNMHTTMGSRTREISYNNGYVSSAAVRSFYTASLNTLLSDLKNLSTIIPPNELNILKTMVDSNFTSTNSSVLWGSVVALISSSSGGGGQPPSGNRTSPAQPPSGNGTSPGSAPGASSTNTTQLLAAQKVLTSQDFLAKESLYTKLFEGFLDRLIGLCWDSINTARGTLIASLVLICLSIALVIPFALLIFMIGLINSSKDEKKLFKANAILLFETMDSPNLRPLFEKFCKSAGRSRQFNFISKTRDYAQLCKRSLELQMRTFEISQDFMKGDELIEKPNALVIKQINQNEKFLKEVEYMKQQVAFEVLECLDTSNEMGLSLTQLYHDELIHHIDQFNNKEEAYEVLDILPVELFERCEEEVTQSLIEVHNYFKESDDFVNAVSIIYK